MITLFILLGLIYNSQNPDWNSAQYAKLWSQVEKAIKAGKPQTAAQYLAELEEMTQQQGDDLERLEVMKQRYECLQQFNWKDANEYSSGYFKLREKFFSYLDANIEKYNKHPMVIMLITEKIDQLYREEEQKIDGLKNEDTFKNIRKMCQEAVQAYPKSDYAKKLRGLIQSMDEKTLVLNGPSKGYPGSTFTYEIDSRNVAAADMIIYRMSGRYDIGNADSFKKYNGNDARCKEISRRKLSDFANKYNISDETKIEWTFPEEGLYVVYIGSGNANSYQYVNISKVAVALREVKGRYEFYSADARSGKPYSNPDITAYSNGRGKALFLAPEIISNKQYKQNGFTALNQQYLLEKEYSGMLVVHAEGDIWAPQLNVFQINDRKGTDVFSNNISTEIFTDRKLYKSSDKVLFKIIAYESNGTTGKVLPGKKIKVELFAPAESKPVAELLLTTNEYGSADGQFSIPKGGRNGSYSIRTGGASCYFRVEEYQTPDFFMEMSQPAGLYAFDDIITQNGDIKGYSGVPMAGAKVEYEIFRYVNWRIWNNHIRYDREGMDRGSVMADAQGHFAISFRADKPQIDEDNASASVTYTIEIKVTDRQGETHEASSSFVVGDTPLTLSSSFEHQYEVDDSIMVVNKDLEKQILINANNLNYLPQIIDGKFRLLRNGAAEAEGSFVSGKALDFDFSALPSGQYKLEYEVNWRGCSISDSTEMALFSPSDSIIPIESKLFFYPLDDEGNIEFVIGTSEEDLYLELELFDRDKQLYRVPVHLQKEARRICLSYQSNYNDCVELSLFAFRDFEQHHITHSFRRPMSPTTFELQIESFRDKTAPRTQESFIVKSNPSELTISIFDITTDRYDANSFDFLPFTQYDSYSPDIRINLDDYDIYYAGGMMTKSMMNTPASRNESMMADMMVMEEEPAADDVEEVVRSDFGETLAFYPHIEIGANGEAEIKYSTKDAFGTYRVLILAHDKNLNSGRAEKQLIVQKELMMMPSLPLFATEGDKIVLKSNVVNMGGRNINATANISFTDKAGKRLNLGTKDTTLSMAAESQSEVAWEVTIPEGKKLFVTITVAGADITDGEKNVIEIVPAVQEITESASFVLGGSRGRRYYEKQLRERLGKFNPELRYEEYNTLDAARAALTAPERPINDNMISWLNVLYVSQMRQIVGLESDKSMSTDAVAKLVSLQHFDGGFSWFPCMMSSDDLTILFLEKLWQLQKQGVHAEGLEMAVKKAVSYIDGRISSIGDSNNWNWQFLIDYFAVRTLYDDVPMPAKVAALFNSYLNKSANDWQNLSILSKAKLCNTIIRVGGRQGRVEELLASLADYAVTNKTIGCYFPNAVMPYRGLMSNEIYAHAQLLELFEAVGRSDIVTGLQQWLLLQKHNQAWESNMSTADAVYALVGHKAEDLRLGAVYATYMAPMVEVEEFGNEMTVKRSFWRDGKELTEGDNLKLGDKIEVRYNLWNSENRSFVEVNAMRAACFYPQDERSWGSSYFYMEQTASGTKYYFQLLAEEDTLLKETFYVTQDGTFNAGLVDMQSLYAPEYRAHSGGLILK
ncbi:MAG: hypothetical protein GX664_06235 [Bacteroidales bacterium]|nr:hypothetical protein [Bacteroidales bacterium]